MAEEQDPKVSAAYRGLGAEEPPRALDDAILAAARRSARPWSRRWAVPLSLAAVLVLSVTVTLRIQQEQPGIESPAQAVKEVAREAPEQTVAAAQEALQLKAEKQLRPAPRKEPVPFQPAQDLAATAPAAASAPAPAAAPVASAPAPMEIPALRRDAARAAESSIAGAGARQAEERTSRDAEAAARAPQVGPVQALSKRAEPMAAKAMAESPERELERIAQLRRDAKHEEADKALAEFRKRYPDFMIPPLMLERVERR